MGNIIEEFICTDNLSYGRDMNRGFKYPPESSGIQPNYSVQEAVTSADSRFYMGLQGLAVSWLSRRSFQCMELDPIDKSSSLLFGLVNVT